MNNRQSGTTLVELLISLTLSLALIAGIGSLFIQMQKSNKSQRAISSMMDDSRFVQEILQKEIRRTGGLRSRSDVNGRSDMVFLATGNLFGTALNFSAPAVSLATPADGPKGEYIKGVKIGANDTVIIRYQLVDTLDLSDLDPTNSSSPCTKDLMLDPDEDPAVDVHVVTIYYYLSSGSLMCQSRRDWIDTVNFPGALTLVKSQGATELVNNVERMTTTYGVNSDADDSADFYTDAVSVEAARWKDVMSLRFTLLLKSAEDNVAAAKIPLKVDETTYTPADKKLYRVFTTTIALRNQI